MDARITSIENLIATDPGGRDVFALMVADQLQLAARSLQLARRVAIVSGFYVPQAQAGETDGPPGAKVLGDALAALGIPVDFITDEPNAPLYAALGLAPITDAGHYLDRAKPSHLVAIERLGRGADGRYRNMRGLDVTDTTAPLDELFLAAANRGITTIGIGDGGNEVGMGKVFGDPAAGTGARAASTVVATDFCIAAGVSNWGAYGLAGALSILVGRDLLPSANQAAGHIERLVREAGAVDGVTHRNEATVDGIDLAASVRMLEEIRHQIVCSPLLARRSPVAEKDRPPVPEPVNVTLEPRNADADGSNALLVGILGYGETGRAASALLQRRGHRVCVSDEAGIVVEPGLTLAGVETGQHTLVFLERCDLVVASPGVRPDSPIRQQLHRRGIPVMTELEMAYELGDRDLIAITGTVGKRTTVELMQRLFEAAGRPIGIGGNKGRPLSRLLLEADTPNLLAVAVSSFQLESVVHFRPNVAAILNIDEQHLDRHRSLAEYIRTKSRVFMNQGHPTEGPGTRPPQHGVDDVLILPFDDQRLRALSRKHRGRTYFFSARQTVDRGAWISEGRLFINLSGQIEELGPIDAGGPLRPLRFPENLLTSVLTGRLYGIDADAVGEAVRRFRSQGWNE